MAFKRPSRLVIIISAFILLMLIILILTTYFLFWYERVPVDSIAEQFCSCIEDSAVQSSKLTETQEDFAYKSGMNDCFGKAFSFVDDGLRYEEELEYVEIIRDRIFEICPDALGKIYAPTSTTMRIGG